MWARATVSPTLARLASLRPAALPAHPLASWLADVTARDTGKATAPHQLASTLRALRLQAGFWIRYDATGLWVSNGQVGIALRPADAGFAIASLYHLPTHTECIFRSPDAGPPWRLQRCEGGNLVEVAPPGTTPTATVSMNPGAAVIVLTWPGSTRVSLTLTMSEDGRHASARDDRPRLTAVAGTTTPAQPRRGGR